MDNQRPTELGHLLVAYRLCARAEGKSPRTIETVQNTVQYLQRFLEGQKLPTDAARITTAHLRAYMVDLRERQAYAGHPMTPAQPRGLSDYTCHSYLRTLKGFFSWLVREEILPRSPFERIRVPREPHKIIPTFTTEQLSRLLGSIDTERATGFRDHTLILTFLDTMVRVSELSAMRLDGIYFEEGMIRVLGKGNKERLVPMGQLVSRQLWRYVTVLRAEPRPGYEHLVFLTGEGLAFRRGGLEQVVQRHARRAGITGVRPSPHTLRHTAAVTYLRNGGDLFSLQRILGHSSLEMTRRYCQLTDIDVKRIHTGVSPVDNLGLGHHILRGRRPHNGERHLGQEGHVPVKEPRFRRPSTVSRSRAV